MKIYGMTHKGGKDIIHLTHQHTLVDAIEYFATLKQLPLKKFNKIFSVIQIKNKTRNEKMLHKGTD